MDLELKIPPLIVVLVCTMFMWLLDQLILIENLAFNAPWWVYIFFLICGISMIGFGVSEFGKYATTTHPRQPEKATALVQSGIYRWSRNPMYLGFLVMLFSLSIYFGNLVTLAVLPLFIWYMNRFQIIPEEQMMIQKFGDEYRKYQSNVRRWI